MENFQLYRTNVLLGGQMKWDLILNTFNGELLVSDFHLSPVSNKVPYNKFSLENLLNYTHNDNIRKFYKKISGSFYNEFVDPLLSSDWPIICKKNEVIDTHDNTYEMGCRRATYGIYNRQFEFLCPLWLEELKDDDVLKFQIRLVSYDEHTYSYKNIFGKEGSKFLEFKIKNGLNHEFHNKFIRYFKNYCNTIKLNKGNDNIMSVHLTKGDSQIAGVNVDTGNYVVRDLPDLAKNLLIRERPLMEFDSMLIDEFRRNNIIASLLFNFNLCFNVDDLIANDDTSKDIWGQRLMIRVDVYINDKKLCYRDFYSNYDFILKKECKPVFDDTLFDWKFVSHMHNTKVLLENSTLIFDPDLELRNLSENVLNYLKDYKAVELVNKNRMALSIIHWSLYDNNDYILNAYEGYSGYSRGLAYNNDQKSLHIHLYLDTPNIQQYTYAQTSNNVGWCNWVVVSDRLENDELVGKYLEFCKSPISFSNCCTKFDKKWIKNIKYQDDKFQNGDIKDLKVLLAKFTHVSKQYDPDVPFNTDEIDIPNQLFSTNNSEYDKLLHRIFPPLSKTELRTLKNGPIKKEGENKLEPTQKIEKGLWFRTFDQSESLNPRNKRSVEKILYLVSNSMDYLTFAFVMTELERHINLLLKHNITPDVRLVSLLHKMKSADSSNNPPIVSLRNSLIPVKAKGPSLLSTEVEYYKNNDSPTYVLRYSGKIKPTFLRKKAVHDEFSETDPELDEDALFYDSDFNPNNYNTKEDMFNYLYYKDYVSDDLNDRAHGMSNYQKSTYALYANSGLTPLYPSIDYYSLKKISILNSSSFEPYTDPPYVNISEFENDPRYNNIRLIHKIEYPWFNFGQVLFLHPELKYRIKIDKIDRLSLLDEIKRNIANTYGIKLLYKDLIINYIYDLYDLDCSLKYGELIVDKNGEPLDDIIDNYVYDVKLKLK